MRLAANTRLSTYVTDYASPDFRMPTSYADHQISFYNWLVLESRRLADRGLHTAIIVDPETEEVALAYVPAEEAETPELRP